MHHCNAMVPGSNSPDFSFTAIAVASSLRPSYDDFCSTGPSDSSSVFCHPLSFTSTRATTSVASRSHPSCPMGICFGGRGKDEEIFITPYLTGKNSRYDTTHGLCSTGPIEDTPLQQTLKLYPETSSPFKCEKILCQRLGCPPNGRVFSTVFSRAIARRSIPSYTRSTNSCTHDTYSRIRGSASRNHRYDSIARATASRACGADSHGHDADTTAHANVSPYRDTATPTYDTASLPMLQPPLPSFPPLLIVVPPLVPVLPNFPPVSSHLLSVFTTLPHVFPSPAAPYRPPLPPNHLYRPSRRYIRRSYRFPLPPTYSVCGIDIEDLETSLSAVNSNTMDTTASGVNEGYREREKIKIHKLDYNYYVWVDVWAREDRLRDTTNPLLEIYDDHTKYITLYMKLHGFGTGTGTMSVTILPNVNMAGMDKGHRVDMVNRALVVKESM